MRIRFLGSGGGRFVTAYQLRRTAGFLIEDGVTIYVDPGPGAVRALKDFGEDVRRIDILIVSHNHPDHVTDGAVLIEGMTWGTTKKRGKVYAAESTVKSEDYRVLSSYHLNLVEEWKTVRAGDEIEKFSFIRAVHTDEKTVGFVWKGTRTITYYSDTGYWEGMEKYAQDIVIFNLEVTKPLPTHTHPGVVRRVLSESTPKLVFLTHFGMSILRYGPDRLAKELEKEFGVETIAVVDGYEWRKGKEKTLFDF